MRVAVIFGQFGAAADPVNLPTFRNRLNALDIETTLIEHDDSKSAVDFLRDYKGKIALVGSSLGAMSAVVMAGYMQRIVDFVGGFQPSDFDPSGHTVNIRETDPDDVITRAITVPSSVTRALCFRNPYLATTGGLGHATYVLDPDNDHTQLTVIKRNDVHAGDFPPAQDQMVQVLESLK